MKTDYIILDFYIYGAWVSLEFHGDVWDMRNEIAEQLQAVYLGY